MDNDVFRTTAGRLTAKELDSLMTLSEKNKDIDLGAYPAWLYAEEVGLERGDMGHPRSPWKSEVSIPMDITLRVIGRKRMAEIENDFDDFDDDEYEAADELADFLFG